MKSVIPPGSRDSRPGLLSAVPPGLLVFDTVPGACAPGYFRVSLRDIPTSAMPSRLIPREGMKSMTAVIPTGK
jgi:hypothetical protein